MAPDVFQTEKVEQIYFFLNAAYYLNFDDIEMYFDQINVNDSNILGANVMHYIAINTTKEKHFNKISSWNVNVSKQDIRGFTPLYYSIISGNMESFQFLLNQGANVFHRTKNNESLLKIATIKNSIKFVDFLMKKGISPFKKDSFGHSPFASAISKNHYELAKLMLNKASIEMFENDFNFEEIVKMCDKNFLALDRSEKIKFLKESRIFLRELQKRFKIGDFLEQNSNKLNNISEALHVIGLLEKSKQILQTVIFKDKKNINAYVNLGAVLIDLNDLSEVDNTIIQASKIDSQNFKLIFLRAKLNYKRKKYTDALNLSLSTLDSSEGNSLENHIFISDCYVKLDKVSKAIKILKKWDENDPFNKELLLLINKLEQSQR